MELIVDTGDRGLARQMAQIARPAPEAPSGLRVDGLGSAAAERRRDETWRHARIAIAAYYLAEHRGFQPGSEIADWRLAQSQIDAADES